MTNNLINVNLKELKMTNKSAIALIAIAIIGVIMANKIGAELQPPAGSYNTVVGNNNSVSGSHNTIIRSSF